MNNARVASAADGGTLLPTSDRVQLHVDGREAAVLTMQGPADYALATAAAGAVEVKLETAFEFEQAVVRPRRMGIEAERTGARTLRFTLTAPAYVSVEFDGNRRDPLLLLVDTPEVDQPPEGDGELLVFEGGHIHEVGGLDLRSGQRVWIREGAVVRGTLRAKGQRNIAIGGLGVLDGSHYPRLGEPGGENGARPRMVHLIDCHNVTLRGLTILDGPTWHVVPTGCSDVEIDRVKILNDAANGDGIDVVGSRDVHIHDCFLRTLDDCIAIKAKAVGEPCG